MAELQSLTVSLQDSFSAGAAAVAQAADKMATAMDKAAGSNTTTDTALRTRGQSLDSVTTKIDGLAAASSRLQQIEQRYQAQVQVLTAGMTAQGKSAGEIADAIARLGTIRDQDAAKARAQGDAIEQRFSAAAASTDRLAAATRSSFDAMESLRAKWVPLAGVMQTTTAAQAEINGLFRAGVLSASETAAALDKATQSYRNMVSAAQAAADAQRQANATQGQGIANTFAGVKPQNIQQDDVDYQKRAADVEAYGEALDATRAKYNPIFAASKQYEAALNGISAAEKQGAISANEAAAARERETASFAQANAPILENADAVRKVGDAHGGAGKAVGALGLDMQRSTLLVHDSTRAFAELANGMPPLMVAMQHIGQLQYIFGDLKTAATTALGAILSPMGLLVTGAAAVATGLIVAGVSAETSSRQWATLSARLMATRTDYLALAEAADAATRKATQATGLSLPDTRTAYQAITSNPNFRGTQDDIQSLIALTQKLSISLGGDLTAALQKVTQGLVSPTAAIKKMAEDGITSADYDTVKLVEKLERLGNTVQAQDAVWDAYNRSLGNVKKVGLTPLQQALEDLTKATTLSSGKGLIQGIGEAVVGDLVHFIKEITDLINAAKEIKAWVESHTPGFLSSTPTPIVDQNTGKPTAGMVLPAQINGQSASQRIYDIAEANNISAQIADLATHVASIESSGGYHYSPAGGVTTSPRGALGMMQVMPDTARDPRINPTGNLNPLNIDDNILLGLRQLALLGSMKQFGGNQQAIAGAYNAGEGRMANVLAGTQTLPAETADYIKKVTGSPLGSVTIQAGAATIEGKNGAPLGGSDINVRTGGGPNGDLMNFARDAEKAPLSLDNSSVAATRQSAIESATKYANALSILSAAGITSGEAVDELNTKMNAANAAATNALTPAQEYNRSLKDQATTTAAVTEGDKVLAETRQRIAEIERSTGTTFTEAEKREAEATAIQNSANALKALEAEQQRSASNQNAVAAAYEQGYAAVAHLTAQQQAYQVLLQKYPQDAAAIQRELPELTRKYEDVAQAAKNAQIGAATLENQNQLQYLQAETDSLGMNDNARIAMLAHLKAEQELKKQSVSEESELGRAYLQSVDAISAQTAALQLQQNSLTEVKSFFSNTFDTIGNAITQAFATGNLAALKFKDIAKSVASAVVSEFAKLAVINPLKNLLFGGSDPTLSSVGGILGQLFGGGGAVGGLGAAAGLAGTVLGGGTKAVTAVATPVTPSLAQEALIAQGDTNPTNLGSGGGGLLGIGGLGTSLLGLADKIGITGTGGIVSKLTDTVKAISNYSLYSTQAAFAVPATEAEAQAIGDVVAKNLAADSTSVAGGGSVQALGGINVTLGSAVSAIGGIYSAIQGFQRGGVGGAVQGAAGIAGVGLAAAGTGALGAGAAGLAAAAGPYAPIALAAIAIIGSLLPGGHPLNPYDATAVDASGGHLAVGKSATQAMQATSLNTVSSFVQGINDFMSQAHLVLENADGQLGAIGQGIKGMVGLVTDPNQILATLRFKNDPSDTSQFGVAKDALRGMSFANSQALQDELIKIASFADATAAIGVRLKSVGQDLTNIQISNVEGANPSGTGTVTAPNGESIQYLNDLRTALNTDLPQKVFANVQALDDEINSVNQFVGGTLPGLLNPIEKTTSSIMDEVQKVETQYDAAIKQSLQYGLDNTQVLQDAATRAVAIVRASNVQQLNANDVQLRDRLAVATNPGPESSAKQALDNFDLQAQQQRDALTKLWTDTFGDTIKTSSDYLNDMNTLEATLGAERLQVVKQSGGAITDAVRSISAETLQGLIDLVSSYAIRIENVTGQTQLAQLTTLNAQADKERAAFVKSFTDAYGDAILADQTFQAQLATVDATHNAERLALLQSFQQAMDQKFTGLQDLVGSIQARGYAATGDQKDADLLNFDIKARQEQASFQQSFVDLYGSAITANDNYQAQLTTLETVQGEERLAIIKKYADASTAATDAALKTAQGNVTQLFTSLSDYTTRLKDSDQNPLSPTAKYDLASSQFNAVAGAAAAGDAKSAGQLTGYSDALLTASRSVYGSGQQYAADFNRVLDAIQNVTMVPDQLTQSFMTLALQTQTQTLVASLQAVQDEIAALRREFANQTRLQSLAA